MDRSWINSNRLSDEYQNGITEFLEFVKENNPDTTMYLCPCNRCLNMVKKNVDDIRDDLICDGFLKSYTHWRWHGETLPSKSTGPHSSSYVGTSVRNDVIEELISDVGEETFMREVVDNTSEDAETPLYPGCPISRLSATLRLFNLKARNGWTDKSFTELLKLLKELLPSDNTLPDRNYDAKRLLCPMGLDYEKIHACPKDCILYRNEYADLIRCPVCQTPRYKPKAGDVSNVVRKKGIPVKVLWYLPIIPRFRRLFDTVEDAKNLRWHADVRIDDGMLRRPADSVQ